MASATASDAEVKQSFVRRYIFSDDHKVIGIQYFITAGIMGIAGVLSARALREL